MLPKSCGKLLYNAVRETLETMAFADVVPCSIKVAGEEVAEDADFQINDQSTIGTAEGWGEDHAGTSSDPADAWGTVAPSVESSACESWGDSPQPLESSAIANDSADDTWGTASADTDVVDDSDWGKSAVLPPKEDVWGDAVLFQCQ
ncbi:hypothetical protein FACS1894170_08350 [Planctomycetales bacterium]|nr:hypothetical protein FACS1894170_08350 [Planctomycetales bacterium]